MVNVELEIDNSSGFWVEGKIKETKKTMSLKGIKDYLNSLPESMNDTPILWYHPDFDSYGVYTKPEEIFDIKDGKIYV